MDQGKLSGLILIDFQKAFDTVNHEIFCKKLNAVGLNGNSVSGLNPILIVDLSLYKWATIHPIIMR